MRTCKHGIFAKMIHRHWDIYVSFVCLLLCVTSVTRIRAHHGARKWFNRNSTSIKFINSKLKSKLILFSLCYSPHPIPHLVASIWYMRIHRRTDLRFRFFKYETNLPNQTVRLMEKREREEESALPTVVKKRWMFLFNATTTAIVLCYCLSLALKRS